MCLKSSSLRVKKTKNNKRIDNEPVEQRVVAFAARKRLREQPSVSDEIRRRAVANATDVDDPAPRHRVSHETLSTASRSAHDVIRPRAPETNSRHVKSEIQNV